MSGIAFLPFLVGVATVAACNVAARVVMKSRRFDDRPGPNHIGS